jgi:hypothetical protein
MVTNKVDSTVLLTKEEAIILFKYLEGATPKYERKLEFTEEEIKLAQEMDFELLDLYLETKNPILAVNR